MFPRPAGSEAHHSGLFFLDFEPELILLTGREIDNLSEENPFFATFHIEGTAVLFWPAENNIGIQERNTY